MQGKKKKKQTPKWPLEKCISSFWMSTFTVEKGGPPASTETGLLAGCRARKFYPLPEMEHKEIGAEGQCSVLS